MSSVSLNLNEWSYASPKTHEILRGRSLAGSSIDLCEALRASGKIDIVGLSSGLEVRTSSWVGRIVLSDLVITISPKLEFSAIMDLLSYAYGLRSLSLYKTAEYRAANTSFHDLLLIQLVAEIEELLSRGLHKDYLRTAERLTTPRGRVDFGAFIATAADASTEVPCIWYPRTESVLLNQILLDGVRYGAGLAANGGLATRLRMLRGKLLEFVQPRDISLKTVASAIQNLDRRAFAYRSALNLILLLRQSTGPVLDDVVEGSASLGFLFDMNRFFQAVLSRFLHDHLSDFEVIDEKRLVGLFAYEPGKNPRDRRPPTPRPDFIIRTGEEIVAVVDAKYRDLWLTSLPRDMLYQLTMYALGRRAGAKESVIVFPTSSAQTSEQVVEFHDPLSGEPQAKITLRPLHLPAFCDAIRARHTFLGGAACHSLAHSLAFGN